MTATAPTYTVAQTKTSDGRLVWQVLKSGARRFCYSGLNNKQAVEKGKEIARKNRGRLTILAASGAVRSQHDYS